MRRGGTAFTTGLVAALIVIMVAPVMAQIQPAAVRATGVAAAVSAPVAAAEHVDLLVGRSAIIRSERPIKRVSLPTPDIADALVTSPTEVLVHGKAPGTISLLVWGESGQIRSYDVIVRRDLSALEDRVRQLFPGEPIVVTSNGADVVLSGVVSSKYVVEKATSLALGYVEKKDNVVNLLRQDQGLESNQVLLRVRFAEVSRSAMQELGASFFTGPNGYKDWVARSSTQQFPAPDFDSDRGGLVFSDFLNILAFNTKEQLGTVVKALQTKGLFQSLAEPNLVTQNGKEATFLAGGEYPYPVVQGGAGNQAVTIMFKEFGVRLRFTPTITGQDSVHLKVAPEVSALDFGNAVTLEGFRVPAISTRRTETEVELRDGQTFAIAGLIDNSVTQTMSKIPGIGDIPILGLLFKSRAYQKNATELVVMITPQIMRRDSVGVTGDLPRMVQPFLPYEPKTLPPPAPAFSTPRARSVAPVGEAAADNTAAPAAPAAPNGPPRLTPMNSGARPALAPAPAAPVSPAVVTGSAPALAPGAPVAPVAAPTAPEMADPGAVQGGQQEAARELEKAGAERTERERVEAQKAAAVAAQQAEAARKQATKQAESDRKQAEKQAAIARKQAAKQAELDRQAAKKAQAVAEEQAKVQAEIDRRLAEANKKRLAEEQKEAERQRKEQEKLEREREKLERERAKRAAEEAELSKKLEQMRLESERRQEEARREEQEKAVRDRMKRDPWPRLRSRV